MYHNSPFTFVKNRIARPSRVGSLESSLDSLFAHLPSVIDAMASAPASAARTSAVRWYENEESFVARLDLPGVSKDRLSLECEEGVVTVEGKRSIPLDGERSEEKVYSSKIKVPEGADATRISANLEDGVLQLTFPKAEQAKPRRIDIK